MLFCFAFFSFVLKKLVPATLGVFVQWNGTKMCREGLVFRGSDTTLSASMEQGRTT